MKRVREKKESSFKERQTAEVRDAMEDDKTLKTEWKERGKKKPSASPFLCHCREELQLQREEKGGVEHAGNRDAVAFGLLMTGMFVSCCLQTDKKGEGRKKSRTKMPPKEKTSSEPAAVFLSLSLYPISLSVLENDLHYVISFLFLSRSHTNYLSLSSTVQQPGFRADCAKIFTPSSLLGWADRYLKCNEPIALYLSLFFISLFLSFCIFISPFRHIT